ncbi:hypothetical protein [Bifidobacterium sp. ESL0745]|uniref:hypothetical protein n=1 Tax=Bifidobacterium sp. ESL0745 TaxID=2983226 RepID=UPI0023F8C223|nr:hypothetical protein [Bifidobacterium sp. ESL0745]MDF7665258.1 hypothetical protein [Bifidobacterium sp. ESL0745]
MDKNRIKIISVLGLLLSAVLMIVGIYTGLTSSIVGGSSNSSAEKQSSNTNGVKKNTGKKTTTPDNGEKLNNPETTKDGGGFGSFNNRFYAPKDSQLSQKTDIARVFWECSPQSQPNDDNFYYDLSDDQSELWLRVSYPSAWSDQIVGCFASKLGLGTAELTKAGTIEHGWRVNSEGNYNIQSKIMDTGTQASDGSTGWLDLMVKQRNLEGGYGSSAQWYVPAGATSTSVTSKVAKIFWKCAPTPTQEDPNFRYQLSENQIEMTFKVTKPSQLYDTEVSCFATQMNISPERFIKESAEIGGLRQNNLQFLTKTVDNVFVMTLKPMV